MQKLLIISLLTALFAQTALAGTIHGKITDAHTGEPVNGVTVQLAPPAQNRLHRPGWLLHVS